MTFIKAPSTSDSFDATMVGLTGFNFDFSYMLAAFAAISVLKIIYTLPFFGE